MLSGRPKTCSMNSHLHGVNSQLKRDPSIFEYTQGLYSGRIGAYMKGINKVSARALPSFKDKDQNQGEGVRSGNSKY